MNATALISLLNSCISKILKGSLEKDKIDGSQLNATASTSTERKSEENSYFFVLFVMFFYSFLAFTIFLGHLRAKKKKSQADPFEEFMNEKESKNEFPFQSGSAFKFDSEEVIPKDQNGAGDVHPHFCWELCWTSSW
ncbi:potassium voltage-gated channel subfamily E member 3-like [Carcharodon carcharias]|uniref:potassium voltage-gated channel subfamily E member 3-like n=1 Tax=Carcharodon carcharias TaxID=13397 RepID=UPI001B7DDE2B|nr:potassium voltage-gated channel subfamily E member 3-like [Carcharodon carcharias]